MNLFNAVQYGKPKRNKFNLSHEKKLSFKMGKLVPILCQEVVPGDSFRVNTELMMRLQPLVAPIMHRVNVKTEFFFVPNRIVFNKWNDYITGGESPANHTPVVPPQVRFGVTQISAGLFAKGTLADYMGLPTIDPAATPTQTKYINALPFMAYQEIYNEYYRDENLVTKVNYGKNLEGLIPDGETSELLTLRTRAWSRDYFTSALPFAQKGNPVIVPSDITLESATATKASNGAPAADGNITSLTGYLKDSASDNLVLKTIANLGITINDLRNSARVQEWLEKNARAGSRYIESILAHFGILSSDARLQRPEYLGGGSNPIVVSEVLSTFQSGDDTGYPQGNMTGHGISAGNAMGFKRTFEEHGYIIGIMSVLPRTAYFQGIPKHFTRLDKLDYYWPSFAQLGEQEIKNEELYFDVNDLTTGQETFGYQSRYAEYKYQPDTVHGDFRDNLDFWHMARKFTAQPVLNDSFVTADPTKRVFAVTTQNDDELLCQLYHRVDALRPMPYFNNPTL